MSTLSLWTRRDPFAEFDQIVRRTFGPTVRTSGFTPAAEIDRDGDDAVVRLELPGLDVAKDVVVEIERGHLVVRGERRDERAEAKDGRTLREVRYGSFRRSFALPAHVTSEAITAEYDAGILTITVAGAYAGAAAKRIEVTSTADTPAIESAN
ncbi:Hsp20/alpha crystallin family protein [Hamadaea sp. NPDC050747]|uniref:Hsp20/alpha crystallin family protein n=1 Tax=Hamadaea sp. NPDC050747 TaxID=3155789 RepID=UPI0033C4C288